MPAERQTDCVVVGYNDVDFDAFAARQKLLSPHSGAYHEVRANSVVLDGRRLPYMELLNHALERATGRNPHFNVFDAPSLGVCCLKDFLERHGFEVEIINCFSTEKQRFRELLARRPRSVAITTTFYFDSPPIAEVAQFVRAHSPATRIIAGGPHVFDVACHLDARTQDHVFREMEADIYIVDALGELTLARVLQRLRDGGALADVPNLVVPGAAAGTSLRTERAAEHNDLDSNRVRWERFDPAFIAPLAYVRTARGCPFSCSFCNFPIMAGGHELGSITSVCEELDALRAAGTRYLVFVDDTFNVPLPRFKTLLRTIVERGYEFRWISFLRCSNLDEAALDLMQASGCLGVFLGIESGDQHVLNNMHKAADLRRYRWAIAELKRRGIATFASLICGFPGETAESVRNTIEFMEEAAPMYFNVQLYYHDVRTPIQARAAELGIRGGGYSWSHDTMTWREASHWAASMFAEIRSSLPITLHGFSLWAFPYLLSKGISLEQIEEFARISRDLLLSSLEESNAGTASQEARLVALFDRPRAGAH